MEKKHIGENAGIIWNLLSDKQKWTAKKICKETGFSKQDFYCAIGWLARENKIEISNSENSEEHYYLIIEYYF